MSGKFSIKFNILERLVQASTGHPVVTILVVLGITALAAIPASRFAVDTSIEGFFGEDDPEFQAAKQVRERFGEQDSVLVVIDCSHSDTYTAKAYARSLADKLKKDSRWRDVEYKQDISFAAEKAILYMEEQQLDALTRPGAAAQLLGASPGSTPGMTGGQAYFASDNKNLYLVTMGVTIEMASLERNDLLDDLAELIEETNREDRRYQSLEVGFTGSLLVLDYEGDKLATQELMRTGFITFILIFLLLFLSFRSLSLPVLCVVPLVIGILWTTGLVFLVYDRLGIVSGAFAVLLLGLGVDYSIHLLVRFMDEMEEHDDVPLAFKHTFVNTGRAVILGCLTTAAAFFSYYFGETEGLHQLGVIGAAGMLCTLAAILVLLPALVTLRLRFGRFRLKHRSFGILRATGAGIQRLAPALVVVLVGLFVLFGMRAPQVRLSEGMYELMPTELETYRQLQKVKDNFEFNPDYLTCVVDDWHDLERCVREFEKMDEVAEVQSILDYLPENQEGKVALLEHAVKIHPEFAGAPAMAVPPMSWKDLPDRISGSWVSEDGEFLIRILPEGDIYHKTYQQKMLTELREIHPSVTANAVLWTRMLDMIGRDTIRVSLMVSGFLLLIVYLGTRRRNPLYAMACMMPVTFGVLGLLATFEWFGGDLNAFSITMVPLIIGIGIDDGIHIVHRYLEEGRGSLPQVIQHTGKAIFLTTATTCLAFSSFLFSFHPAQKSLGLVPVVGISLCFFAAVIFLPALLRMLGDRRGPRSL